MKTKDARQHRWIMVAVLAFFLMGDGKVSAQTSILPEPGILVAAPRPALFVSRENLLQSLVGIRAVDEERVFNHNGRMQKAAAESAGNGVIIDAAGIIVTNAHIVRQAKQVFVKLSDGRELEARVVYTSEADFSFLKVNAAGALRAIAWADSSRARSGAPVVAIIDRDSVEGGAVTNLVGGRQPEIIEMDLSLKHGDSGGPVLDPQGGLLGIVMARSGSQDHKSYAIAANRIHEEYFRFKGSFLVQ